MKKILKDISPLKKAILKLLIKLTVIAGIIYVFFAFVGDIGVVHDNNNFPNLKDGDLTITYKLDGYYTGDLVKYDFEGKTYFGRIVGVSGDIVNITENSYTVNGLVPYETIYFDTLPMESHVQYPYEVKEGEVFILADYREQGLDSRTLSSIQISNLEGKVVFVFRSRGI